MTDADALRSRHPLSKVRTLRTTRTSRTATMREQKREPRSRTSTALTLCRRVLRVRVAGRELRVDSVVREAGVVVAVVVAVRVAVDRAAGRTRAAAIASPAIEGIREPRTCVALLFSGAEL